MQWNPKLRAISSRSKDEICTKILINDTFRQHAVVMEAKFFLVLFLSSLKLSACSTTDFRGEYQEVPGGKVLFTDSSQVDSMNDGIYFEMHEATHANNGDPVIYPTEEWENWATFAYNTIVKHPNGTYFMYYDCVSSDATRNIVWFTCLATSDDGINWVKPILNIATFHNSTANNIVFPLSDEVGVYIYHEPGSVFIDTNPTVDDSEKWKMLAQLDLFLGTYILASPDGLNWKMLYENPSLNASDTQNVAWYDNEINEYVIFMRIDDDNPREHGGNTGTVGTTLAWRIKLVLI